jgi:hypothetical protein
MESLILIAPCRAYVPCAIVQLPHVPQAVPKVSIRAVPSGENLKARLILSHLPSGEVYRLWIRGAVSEGRV